MEAKRILNEIEKLKNVSSIKNNMAIIEDLQKIKERVEDNVFRIAIVGEFSSGKSTFINALIGKDLLTHAVNETTAAVTRIYNVEKKDARIGTCEIEFNDGRKTILHDMTQLRAYTTTQSSENVADMIRSVSVYVNFLNYSHPIEIVDTPGLNGIADKHREITIEEVKRAHACIYLLSLKGITNSDINFLRILLRYQSEFIFVQNFIDNIHESEYDSLEKKIADAQEILNSIIEDEADYFNYNICGVSALKALCSKDCNIRKLYNEDLRELSDNDRKRLEQESCFSSFEKILSNIIKNGRYKQIILNSAIQAINAIIEETLPLMQMRQEFNAEMQKQDSKTKRIEKANEAIQFIEVNKDDKRRRLKAFIISRDKENRKNLRDETEGRLNHICEEIEQEIDWKIKNYEELEFFDVKNFIKEKESIINSQIIPDIDEQIGDNLSHLYDEAVQRVMRYITNFAGKTEKIDISIDYTKEKLQMKDNNWQQRVHEKEQKLKEDKGKLSKLKEEIQWKDTERKNVNSEKTENERQKDIMTVDYKRDIDRLGKKPDIQRKKELRTRTVERKGFFGKIRDLFGKKTESYYVIIEDDSAQKNWINKRKEYEEKYRRRMIHYNDKMGALDKRLNDLNLCLKAKNVEKNIIETEIGDLQARIEREKQIYTEMEKNNKREYCIAQKKKLKQSFRDRILTGDQCTLEKLKEHIDAMSEIYINVIIEKIDTFYKIGVKEQIESLHRLIEDNSQKLENQYQSDDKDIDILKTVQQSINR